MSHSCDSQNWNIQQTVRNVTKVLKLGKKIVHWKNGCKGKWVFLGRDTVPVLCEVFQDTNFWKHQCTTAFEIIEICILARKLCFWSGESDTWLKWSLIKYSYSLKISFNEHLHQELIWATLPSLQHLHWFRLIHLY